MQKYQENYLEYQLKSVTVYDEEVPLKSSSALLADRDVTKKFTQSYKELLKSENAEK
jgi:hypothetical protein